MTTPEIQARTIVQSPAKVAFASLVGTSIEWYDFFAYGTAAALVFNKLFFPTFDATTGTLLSFSTFTAGFVARPIGGLVFGHLGDRLGRKKMLVSTIMIMGLATVLIGLLPTYAAIGMAAPILLVVLRLLQGFSVGGEWGGAALMAVEHSPDGRRGFYGSWPQMGVPVGLILASAVFLPLAALPADQFLAWGWRLPFLLSFVLVVAGLLIRLKVSESPEFERIKLQKTVVRAPIVEVLRKYPVRVLLIAGAYLSSGIFFYLLAVYNLVYATHAGISRSAMLGVIIVTSLFGLVCIPVIGKLADRVGRRRLYVIGQVLIVAMAFPVYWSIDSGSLVLVTITYLVSTVAFYLPYAIMPAYFSELFGAGVRYSGLSLGTTVGTILGNSLAPLIAGALLAATGSATSISVYVIATALLSLACLLGLADRSREKH
ncbi:MFS transporter [Amycolatopsis sp. NPDC005232]|uniref:MFS transporter n=1 Tax=Amycolatopsis sp. NPDC005232 TaxID=3157027 RepID=UPI0033BA9B22